MFVPNQYHPAIFDWFKNPSGHAVIYGVAGCGKSSTMVEGGKLMALEQQRNCLVSSYTTSTVADLKSKLQGGFDVRSINSYGFLALRNAFRDVRWDLENGKNKYRQMAREVAVPREYGEERVVRDALVSMVNFAQLTLTPLEVEPLTRMAKRFNIELPPTCPIDKLAEVVKDMLQRGIEQAQTGFISFSDQAYVPIMLNLPLPRYQRIILDECQDSSKLNMTLLMRGLAEGGIFGGAGDPNQAIFLFAGSEPDSFYQLKNHFSAEEFPLHLCYRCPTSVVKEAQEIVPEIQALPGAPEGKVAIITHETFIETLTRGDMVICRSTAPLMKLCFELIGRGIPATVEGRDIGAKMSGTIKTIQKRNYDVKAFPRLAAEWLESGLEMLRGKLGTEAQQESMCDQYEALSLCYTILRSNSVAQFCDGVYGMFDEGKSPIRLSTIHRVKGLQNPRVFIIRPEKMPLVWKGQSPAEFRQENNLLYVAITRAQKELYYVTTPDDEQPQLPGMVRREQ